MDKEIKSGLLNLHDAFLNAALMEREKWAAPLDSDPEKFHISDHGRFERMWVTFLYVLVESWNSSQMTAVRAHVESIVSTSELTSVLDAGRVDGSLAKMRDTRHYMCHRDQREYWDDGRLAVCGQLEYHVKLHAAFSRVLLTAVKAASTYPA
jgi:hypothetical protein